MYAMLYRADNADRTVLFCNPIFEERKAAHRSMVEAANLLCGAGFNVMTFDYRGCGDSEGDAVSCTADHWVTDVLAAARFAAEMTGCTQVGLLGLRFGASLAVKAMSASPSRFTFAALWAPVISGRVYVDRELRKKLAKEMATFGKSSAKRSLLIEKLESGESVDFDGHCLSAELYRTLSGFDLMDIAPSVPARLLVVSVSHSLRQPSDDARLVSAFHAADSRVVALQPFWNLIGYTDTAPLREATLEWIAGLSGVRKPEGTPQT